MIALGLDIATKTGWGKLTFDGARWTASAWGCLDLSPTEKDEPEGARFLRMADMLPPLLDGVDAVVIEQTFSRSARSRQILHGLIAVALVPIERRNLPYVFVGTGTWKKFAVGKGHAKKPEVRESLNGWAGIEPGFSIGENAADALAMCRWLIPSLKVHYNAEEF